jgi:phosphoribosylglycinamide formyltransferase 2
VRAILGLPVPLIRQWGPAASCAILGEGDSNRIRYAGVDAALREPDTDLRLFGKPEVHGKRRLGVALARGETIEEARDKARRAAAQVQIRL